MSNPYSAPQAEIIPQPNPPAGTAWDALRFWERGRIAYNGAQLLLTGIMVLLRLEDAHFFRKHLGQYIGFAIMANVLYCGAYVVELLLRIPFIRPYRRVIRWLVLIGGTILACAIAGQVLDIAIFSNALET